MVERHKHDFAETGTIQLLALCFNLPQLVHPFDLELMEGILQLQVRVHPRLSGELGLWVDGVVRGLANPHSSGVLYPVAVELAVLHEPNQPFSEIFELLLKGCGLLLFHDRDDFVVGSRLVERLYSELFVVLGLSL